MILKLVQGYERGILGPMKDSDITVYKSFLLKLFYGAPGWPVSRFRPGVLVFILPDFGRDTDDLGGRTYSAADSILLIASSSESNASFIESLADSDSSYFFSAL